MDKKFASMNTRRLTDPDGALAASDVTGQPEGNIFRRLFVWVLGKMGYEIHSWSKPGDKVHIREVPQLAWDGVKGVAHNSRSVMRNKTMAFDKPLFVLVVVLIVVGFIMMSSASYAYSYSKYGDSMYLINRQLIFIILGMPAMIFVSTLSPDKLKGKVTYGLWALSLVLLVVVLFKTEKNGVHRWIGVGPLTFQPSEIAKFAAILVCSNYICFHYKELNVFTYGSQKRKQKAAAMGGIRNFFYRLYRNFITGVWPFVWRVVPILILLVKEPHLSCTIIILLITGTLMLLGGTRKEFFLALLVIVGIAVYLIVFLGVVPYGRSRVEMWLDPFADAKGDGWQTVQSLYAISSGGIFGSGFGNSRQKYMYIAEPQNDFIFAVVCEEVGLVGAIVIILIFVAFVWRGFALSVANPDRFRRFVGIGITCQVGYQMMLNIAVVTNMVPNTGISLPFFSYGGTSLLMLMVEIGVLLAISRSSPNKVM